MAPQPQETLRALAETRLKDSHAARRHTTRRDLVGERLDVLLLRLLARRARNYRPTLRGSVPFNESPKLDCELSCVRSRATCCRAPLVCAAPVCGSPRSRPAPQATLDGAAAGPKVLPSRKLDHICVLRSSRRPGSAPVAAAAVAALKWRVFHWRLFKEAA